MFTMQIKIDKSELTKQLNADRYSYSILILTFVTGFFSSPEKK